ncbi:MAG TPA: hypothetical protein VHS99_15655 [Chloroflexota bacterium]|nr:hypothetical protein [Chloroflexota bacterium]
MAEPILGTLTVLFLLGLSLSLALGGAVPDRLWTQGQHASPEQWMRHVWLESLGMAAHHHQLGAGQTGYSHRGQDASPVATVVTAPGIPRAQLLAAPPPPGASPDGSHALLAEPTIELPAPLAGRPPAPWAEDRFTPPPLRPPDQPPRFGR